MLHLHSLVLCFSVTSYDPNSTNSPRHHAAAMTCSGLRRSCPRVSARFRTPKNARTRPKASTTCRLEEGVRSVIVFTRRRFGDHEEHHRHLALLARLQRLLLKQKHSSFLKYAPRAAAAP